MIRAQALQKSFSGRRVLGPLSFTIDDGETVGFLGLNGAGKTTALRILACDLRPSAGSVHIDGIDALENPHEVRRHVGFLPENPPLYPDMSVGEFLRFAGRLRGLTAREVAKRVPEVAARTHIDDVQGEPIRNLSHGYRQRVGVAQAVIHQPKLVILDEPTRGLDPVQIVEMRQMVRELKAEHTVLISSHILTEISETCDRMLVLGDGAIVGSGTEEELSQRVASSRRIVVGVRPRGTLEDALAAIRAVPGVVEAAAAGAADGGQEIAVSAASDVREELCRALVEKGHGVISLGRAQHKLESIFLELVKGDAHAGN
jgi:gliding motility-associated transport system ATP-binding protein